MPASLRPPCAIFSASRIRSAASTRGPTLGSGCCDGGGCVGDGSSAWLRRKATASVLRLGGLFGLGRVLGGGGLLGSLALRGRALGGPCATLGLPVGPRLRGRRPRFGCLPEALNPRPDAANCGLGALETLYSHHTREAVPNCDQIGPPCPPGRGKQPGRGGSARVTEAMKTRMSASDRAGRDGI